jgi:hypothetical protein
MAYYEVKQSSTLDDIEQNTIYYSLYFTERQADKYGYEFRYTLLDIQLIYVSTNQYIIDKYTHETLSVYDLRKIEYTYPKGGLIT